MCGCCAGFVRFSCGFRAVGVRGCAAFVLGRCGGEFFTTDFMDGTDWDGNLNAKTAKGAKGEFRRFPGFGCQRASAAGAMGLPSDVSAFSFGGGKWWFGGPNRYVLPSAPSRGRD
jgi:hypothetical protein